MRDDLPERVDSGGVPSTPPENKNSRLMQIVLMLVISAAVVFAMNSFLFKSVSQPDFDTNLKNVASDISALKNTTAQISSASEKANQASTDAKAASSSVNTLDARVKTLESKTADLSDYATKGDLNLLKDSLNNLTNNSTVQTLQNQIKAVNDNYTAQAKTIESLNATVKTLQDDVAKLKATPTPTSTPTSTPTNNNPTNTSYSDGKILLSVKDLGTEIYAGAYGFDGGDSIKVTITNKGTSDITDLRFNLYVYTEDTNIPASYVQSKMTLLGDLGFSLVSSSADEYQFRSSRISIGAGKTKNYYLTPDIIIKPDFLYIVKADYYTSNSLPLPTYGSYSISGVNWYYVNALPTSDVTLYKVVDSSSPSTTYGVSSRLQEDVTFYEGIELIDYN